MTTEVQNISNYALSTIYAIGGQAPNMMNAASNLTVDDQEGCNSVLSLCGEVKDILNQLESFRKAETEPHRKYINSVNSAAKDVELKLKEILSLLTAKLALWQKQLEGEMEVRKAAAKSLTESLGIEMDVFLESPKTLSNADAIASTKIKLSWEIENIELIPREYLILDEVKIGKAVKMGVSITGVKVIETKELQVRKR